MVWLNCTYYSLLKITSKIFKIVFTSQIPADHANSVQFAHIVREPREICTFVNLFYIMFQTSASTENAQEFQQITQIPCSLPTQSANYAKFAPFANITPYVSDAWPVAENSLKFQRIKQNSLDSPIYSTNYANSVHFTVN